jgi:NAD(P)-dependent dehydrogenase (short-subunit alcohol dehydrogenase family)
MTGELLLDKVAIVTGAAQGIGRGIAHAFARQGADVAVVDIAGDRAAKTADELMGLGRKAIAVACDVSRRDDVDRAVAETIGALGGVEILVNTAIAGAPKVPLLETTDDLMMSMFGSGTMGTLYFMQACYEQLRERSGRIINFGSGAAVDGSPGYAAYGPAKEGIRSLSKVAAREWGPEGIRVNIICPHANSPLQQYWAEREPGITEQAISRTPLRRLGDCEDDIGRAAVFLASDLSAYVTGQTLMVDGGLRML